MGASFEVYRLAADGAIAQQIFKRTQDVFEQADIRWPARGSKESILEFMAKVKELMHEAHRVEAGGAENESWSWGGGEDPNSCYNVQCILRPIVDIFADFDPSTGEIKFAEWLKYLPDQYQGRHCTDLGSSTYSQVLKQFAPLTPPEVSSWACLLSGMPDDRLKRHIATKPCTIWQNFITAAAKQKPSEGDVFTLAATEFLEGLG